MKKFFAIIMAICLMASAFSASASAALLKDFDATPVGAVLRVSALKRGETNPALIKEYTDFKDGWNAAMEIAGDEDEMDDNGYDRIVVDLLTDWEANDDGQFSDDWVGGPGFDNDTIYVPEEARVTLNLNGHTIDRGLTEDEDDGEIIFINDDADVIINNGTITGGYSNSEGGCLYIEGGANVTLNDVHIVNNRVHNDEGAGVYMYGSSKLTVNGGSFENNTADGNGAYGGAVFVIDSTATFNNVVFKNNRSQYRGAAIYDDNSDVTIKNCTFDGNEAEYSTLAAYAGGSSFDVSGSTFVNNKSKYMFELDYSTLTVNSSEFKNNDHYCIIYAGSSNTVQVTNSTFTDNDACVIHAASYGLDEGSYCRDCTFDENTYKDQYKDLVGALAGSFAGNFTNMVFYDCDFGNSIFKYANNVTIENSKDSAVDAALSVTLLHKDGTQKTTYYKAFDFGWDSIVDAVETNNYERVIVDLLADWNTNEYGVITIPENAKMTINMNGHTIDRGLGKNNQDDGEVIYIDEDADVIINNGTITGGKSTNGAGGIHIHDAHVTLNDVHIVGNVADNDDGGGIALYDDAVLVMNGGSFRDNTVDGQEGSGIGAWECMGAAIYIDDSKAIFSNVEFKNNQNTTDSDYGAAIYVNGGEAYIDKCTFDGNGIKDDAKGYKPALSIIHAEDSTVKVENSTFTNNGYNHHDLSTFFMGGTIGYASAMFTVESSKLTISGDCKFTNNATFYMFELHNGTSSIYASDATFTDNGSSIISAGSFLAEDSYFKNCTFNNNLMTKPEEFYQFNQDFTAFSFRAEECTLTLEGCDMGNSTYDGLEYIKFVDCDNAPSQSGVGSVFGEGSLSMIVAFVALIASVAAIVVNVSSKKKAVPATANNADKSEDEE